MSSASSSASSPSPSSGSSKRPRRADRDARDGKVSRRRKTRSIDDRDAFVPETVTDDDGERTSGIHGGDEDDKEDGGDDVDAPERASAKGRPSPQRQRAKGKEVAATEQARKRAAADRQARHRQKQQKAAADRDEENRRLTESLDEIEERLRAVVEELAEAKQELAEQRAKSGGNSRGAFERDLVLGRFWDPLSSASLDEVRIVDSFKQAFPLPDGVHLEVARGYTPTLYVPLAVEDALGWRHPAHVVADTRLDLLLAVVGQVKISRPPADLLRVQCGGDRSAVVEPTLAAAAGSSGVGGLAFCSRQLKYMRHDPTGVLRLVEPATSKLKQQVNGDWLPPREIFEALPQPHPDTGVRETPAGAAAFTMARATLRAAFGEGRITGATTYAAGSFEHADKVDVSGVSFPSFLPPRHKGGALDGGVEVQDGEEDADEDDSVVFGAAGVTSPFVYIAEELTPFNLHREDLGLPSINTLVQGAPKVWLSVWPADRLRLEEQLLREMDPSEFARSGGVEREEPASCPQWVRHASVVVQPAYLDKHTIRHLLTVQLPGETVLTAGETLHEGFNAGANEAWSINVHRFGSTGHPVEYGCDCGTNTVRVSKIYNTQSWAGA